MSDNGDLREDLKVPDGDIGAQLKTEYDAGKELLVSFIKALLVNPLQTPGVMPCSETHFLEELEVA